MLKLSTIIRLNIAINSAPQELKVLNTVDRKFQALLSSNYFWYLKFKRDYNHLIDMPPFLLSEIEYKEIPNWHEIFKLFQDVTGEEIGALDAIIKTLCAEQMKNLGVDNLYLYLSANLAVRFRMINWFKQLFPDSDVYDYVFQLIGSFLTENLTNTFPVLYGHGDDGKTTFRCFLDRLKLPRYTRGVSDNEITSFNIRATCNNYNTISEGGHSTEWSDIDNDAYHRIKIILCGPLRVIDNKFYENTQQFGLYFVLFLIPYAIKYIKKGFITVPEIVLRNTQEICGR